MISRVTWAGWGDLLDVLLNGVELGDGLAIAGVDRQRDFGLFVQIIRDDPISPPDVQASAPAASSELR